MNQNQQQYLEIFSHSKEKEKDVLIDTNLLLLLIVGTCDRDRIAKFKRTETFTKDDYDLLVKIIRFFKQVVVTPNILTEVSNLLGQLPEDLAPDFYKHFSSEVSNLLEKFSPSRELVIQDYFLKFGLTDSSIILNAKEKYVVLTVDLPLFGYLGNKGVKAINFNHLRSF
jgi:hypothetical protein